MELLSSAAVVCQGCFLCFGSREDMRLGLMGAHSDGEQASVYWRGWGSVYSPESSPECVRGSGSVWTNSSRLGAVERRCLGGMKEEEQAVKKAWSRRGIN